jgi:hypothetical protein
MTNIDDKVNFRAGDMLPAILDRGDTKGRVAKRDLERYYTALERELRDVALSENEVLLIVDACNGVLFEPHTIPLLWAEVDEAILQDHLDAKWGVDGTTVVTKLRLLSYTQTLAVVDAVERAWLVGGNMQETIRAVGLVS